MCWQAFLLVACAATYIAFHWKYPAKTTFPTPEELVQFDGFGSAHIISAEDLDWYVGNSKAVPLLAILNQRNQEIESKIGGVRQLLVDFGGNFASPSVQQVREFVDGGSMNNAVIELANFQLNLAPGSQANGGDRVLNLLEDRLRELSRLRSAQEQTRSLLTPPRKLMFFWGNPWGIAAEVIAWSLFGLFASLLFHSAQAVSEGTFEKSETIVGWAKFFYTPIVSIVVVMAVVFGVMNVESVETRVWMIPLLGVLCGWNCRKSAVLVDSLSDWTLGRLARSLNREGRTAVSASISEIQNALKLPETFDEIADKGKEVAAVMVAKELKNK